MNHRNKYSIFDKEKIVAFIALVIVLILIGFGIGSYCRGEDDLTVAPDVRRPTKFQPPKKGKP